MDNSFNQLTTEKFRVKLRPAALKIYSDLFPECHIEDLREQGVKVHILDKEFAIDSLLHFKDRQWISLQEKYRSYQHFKRFGDFTQEYKNAVGTQYESDGEWFKLGAQLYFYGWSNEDCSDFIEWIILDIPKYKILVDKNGGINKMGFLNQNNLHGKSTFYGIPLKRLQEAIIFRKNNNETPNQTKQGMLF